MKIRDAATRATVPAMDARKWLKFGLEGGAWRDRSQSSDEEKAVDRRHDIVSIDCYNADSRTAAKH
jgi:hypothetical protein